VINDVEGGCQIQKYQFRQLPVFHGHEEVIPDTQRGRLIGLKIVKKQTARRIIRGGQKTGCMMSYVILEMMLRLEIRR